ncbi:hypothetical protein SAMD00019534_112630 [Acytostelium subglobosum LB1]|uniref:hypothetical protein n=1 Tax=Acytostelium subglobosum LB1 TaxID=1410327 RepID=UPI000644D83E|nr:hypothetical protein SAMD00019534_112630 [Acytostelium subglobosum LB1]GAM28087.1 hypothetical protein SAMD00019534_112630 [Acytostelium subglobosum LB1]|eukprot:XP_012749046.1 hypothetical protein SAMD00019534_112630 [Acytostelium subglobosum LB1]
MSSILRSSLASSIVADGSLTKLMGGVASSIPIQPSSSRVLLVNRNVVNYFNRNNNSSINNYNISSSNSNRYINNNNNNNTYLFNHKQQQTNIPNVSPTSISHQLQQQQQQSPFHHNSRYPATPYSTIINHNSHQSRINELFNTKYNRFNHANSIIGQQRSTSTTTKSSVSMGQPLQTGRSQSTMFTAPQFIIVPAAKRHFHSNLPNYFVFSKTLRLVLPFAMGGIREWIRQGNSLLRFAFICVVMFGSCGLYIYFNQESAPITGRSRFIGVTVEEERDISDMGYASVMELYADSILPDNNVLQNQVRLVAKSLIPYSGIQLPWECHVINSPEVNAFVLPNGKIFVFTGLFEIVQTEDELAAVMSHEIGHAIARHSAERMSLLKVGIVFLTLTRGLLGDTITGNVATMITTYLLELSYSRMQEIEADIIGLGILKSAGYNLQAAISVQEKLAQLSDSEDDSKIVSLLATHPKCSDRVSKMKEWITEHGTEPNTITIQQHQHHHKHQHHVNNKALPSATPSKLPVAAAAATSSSSKDSL